MDFAYTTDAARASLLAAMSAIDKEVYSVAGGVETSLEGLDKALVDAMGSGLDVEYGPALPVSGVTRRLASAEARARDLGFTATGNLDEGLRPLVDWWRAESVPETAPAGGLA